MEEYKKYNEIMQPDVRTKIFVKINQDTGEQSPIQLKNIHEEIMNIKLSDTVPIDIQEEFNIAKNLSLYSWFCYPFHQISEMKTFSTLEYSLKHFCTGRGLRNYLEQAVKDETINDSIFSHLSKHSQNNEYSKKLPEIIGGFRSDLAHSKGYKHFDSELIFIQAFYQYAKSL